MLGYNGKRRKPKQVEAVKERINKLHKQGLSSVKIGKRLRMHYTTCLYHLGTLKKSLQNKKKGV
jgi:hypothetical protein